jgi:CHAD domain-containing protein
MSLSLRQNESVRGAIRRNARKRIATALELLDAKRDGDTGERIHEARKNLKQVRALARLMRFAAGRKHSTRIEGQLRRVMHALSEIRDATVLRALLPELGQRARLLPDSLAIFRATLEYRFNRACEDTLGNPGHRESLQKALHRARKEILSWDGIKPGWRAIGPGIEGIFADARAAAAATTRKDARNDEALHRTRKRAKDLLHVLEFLREVDRDRIEEQVRIVHQFADLLGKDHDLAMMQALIEGPLHRHLARPELRRFLEAIAAQRRHLQQRAFAVAEIAYADDEVTFVKELHRSWRQWRGNEAERSKAGSVERIRTYPDAHRPPPRAFSSS